MFGARISWVRFSKNPRNFNFRGFCNQKSPNNKQQESHSSNASNNNGGVGDVRDLEGYRDLDKLDFMKAAKILFSDPPKKKKFGIDFHLVQLFFALMPPLAVYLVAQYARYDMRKMEAELEVKKKAEEEQKAKEMEAIAEEETVKAARSDKELLKVKERLEALEETVKEIVVETKKQPSDEKSKNVDHIQKKENHPDSRLHDRNQPTPQEARPAAE